MHPATDATVTEAPSPAGPVDHPTEELASRLRLCVNRLHRLLRQESLDGLSPAQASTLGAVKRLGSPTLGELAAVEQVQPPSMTRIVATLTDAGMVTRITDDGRSPERPGAHHPRRGAVARADPHVEERLPRPSPLRARPRRAGRGGDLVELLEHLVGR